MMMARRLAREEGILVGGSAGLNVALALDIARELDDPDACVVTILCDTGERYLSKVFNDDWMQENQLLDRPQATVEQLLQQRRPTSAPALVQVAPAAAVRQALNLMSSWEVSQIPVIENGEPVGGLVESALMTRALAQPALLDRPVREVMDPPFPVVEHTFPTDRLAPMLTRENPAALVRKDGALIGIVSRYDVLQQLIGTREQRAAGPLPPSRSPASHADHSPHRRHLRRARCCTRIGRASHCGPAKYWTPGGGGGHRPGLHSRRRTRPSCCRLPWVPRPHRWPSSRRWSTGCCSAAWPTSRRCARRRCCSWRCTAATAKTAPCRPFST